MNPMMRSIYLLLSLVIIDFATFAQNRRPAQSGAAQTPPSSQPSASAPELPNILAESGKDYLICSGDVIEIMVSEGPELSRNYRVNARGSFEMQVLGRIEAKGRTTEELARAIAKGLHDREYLKDPDVVVAVKQYNSQTFFVQGAVNRPGVYQVEGAPTLLMMIGLAGGLNDNHGSTAFIIRNIKPPTPGETPDPRTASALPEPPAPQAIQAASIDAAAQAADADSSPEYELVRVNLSALYKGRFDQNQRLQPGDIINIPRSDVFFVAGEVQAPGSYPLKEGTTLRQAISLAQGMTYKAKPAAGIIFREAPDTGKREEIKIDINAAMSGKADDPPILANDVIIVPNSRAKSVGGTLLMAFGVSAARLPIR